VPGDMGQQCQAMFPNTRRHEPLPVLLKPHQEGSD
jgi:hypothetical protein